jgi:hypothetical protein
MGGGTLLMTPHPGSFHFVKFADPPHRKRGEGGAFSDMMSVIISFTFREVS